VQFFVGTSGYSHKEWQGSFYPPKLPPKQMLRYYSQRLPAVEINNTFYRMPSAKQLASWAEQTPASFRFALKAPQFITHRKRLKNVEGPTAQLVESVTNLQSRQGPLLFQLPPNMMLDVPRLEAFLRLLPDGLQAAFEFRHESWSDSRVFDCLRAHRCALCVAEADGSQNAQLIRTADWAYVRLRREQYADDELAEWVRRLRSQAVQSAYVFFKHDAAGEGPRLAARLLQLAGL
jgi:uncharacterized protein YecE (DUF72 family)